MAESKNIVAKLASVIRPATTAEKRAATERAIAAIESELSELRTTLAATLVDDDEGIEAAKLSNRIAAAEQRLSLQRARLAALAKQTRKETTDQRQRAKEAGLATMERNLADKAAAAGRVDRVLAELAVALQEYRRAHQNVFSSWLGTFPPANLYEGYYQYPILPGKLGAALNLRDVYGMLTGVGERLGSLSDLEIEQATNLIASLRGEPLPPLHDDDDQDGQSGVAA